MVELRLFVELAGNAILFAAIFTLVNVGVVLLYRSTGVLSFAQGYFLMLGAYVMTTIQPTLGYWLGLLVTALILTAVGWITYQFAMRFAVGMEEFTKAVATFLIALLLAQLVTIGWGNSSRFIDPPVRGGIHIHGTLPWTSVIVLGMAVGALALIGAVLKYTRSGMRMQALAQNETLAGHSGFRIHRLAATAWALAGFVAALAGVAYAESTAVTFSVADIGLLAFPAAVLGGLTSLTGSAIGGAVLAVLSTIVSYNLGSAWAAIVENALMLVILVFFPFGLMGKRVARRI